MDVGPGELLLVVAVLVLLFGSKKLPELARGLAEAKRELERPSRSDAGDAAEELLP
jgi:sec-independent protein translocase protein TatA